MHPAKTVAAIHDLSGIGRCALTVVIPVISAMGIQVCPAPTAVLSAHTAFEGIEVRDLTDFLRPCLDHWTRLGQRFDAVYSGYLASPEQIEIVGDFIAQNPNALSIVDPVMGDNGSMYRGMSADMPAQMRRLCASADWITPNMTEYALLTGEEYSTEPRRSAQIERMLAKLIDATGAKGALITSVPTEDGLANAYRGKDGRAGILIFDRLPSNYHGTGDLFASVFTGALVGGDSCECAVRRATEYVRETIRQTMRTGTHGNYGVQLESTLGLLTGPSA